VKVLLERGERRLLVDLSRVRRIDAAGVGELVRLFNAVRAAGGALQIAYANARVERLLRQAGVFEMLSAGIAISTRRGAAEYRGRAG
jgi:anti-anti-sigma factor